MKICDQNAELYLRVVEEFKTAEDRLKEVEVHFAETGYVCPAGNELRYAGFHIVKALKKSESHVKQAEELNEAIIHCRRASYDAMEAGLLAFFDKISSFQYEYKDVSIVGVIPDWTECMVRIDVIRDDIVRAERRAGDEVFVALNGYTKELHAITKKAKASEEELKKLRRAHRTENKKWVLGVLLALAALVAAIVIG